MGVLFRVFENERCEQCFECFVGLKMCVCEIFLEARYPMSSEELMFH